MKRTQRTFVVCVLASGMFLLAPGRLEAQGPPNPPPGGGNLVDRVATLEGLVATLVSDLDTAEGRIDTLEGDLATAVGRIATLEGDLTLAEADILTLQTNLTAALGRITTLEGSMSTAQSDITGLEGNVDTIYMELAIVQEKVSALAPEAEGLVFWNTLDSPDDVESSAFGPGGTISGGTFVEGYFGDAYSATNTEDQLVSFPTAAVPRERGTIEFWARISDFGPNVPSAHAPYFVWLANSNITGYNMGFNSNDGTSNGGLVGRVGGGGVPGCGGFTTGTGFSGGRTYASILGAGQEETWHHYALVWDIDGIAGVADGTKHVACFLDGQLDSTRWFECPGAAFGDLGGATLDLVENNFSQGTTAIDNIKVWNYARTAFEDRFSESPFGDAPEGLSEETEEILDHMSIVQLADGIGGTTKTIRFSEANVQIVNGEGATEAFNGLGNLIVGYNELRPSDNDRTGSHMIVAGDENNYSSFGGIVAGQLNATSGVYASVTGGLENTANGEFSSVSGGRNNTASGDFGSSVSGGRRNTASGWSSSVSGGWNANASDDFSSVSGGSNNVASGEFSSVSGGLHNTASGAGSSVSGGSSNIASGDPSSVSGGFQRIAPGDLDWVAGGLFQDH